MPRLGDARLTQRLIRITHTRSKNPEESLPSAFAPGRDAVKAVYRFSDNDSVLPAEILATHRAATLTAAHRDRPEQVHPSAAGHHAVRLHHTSRHPRAGTGPTGALGLASFFLHSTRALEPDGGRWLSEVPRGRCRATGILDRVESDQPSR